MNIPIPSTPDQDVEELIEQALEDIGEPCTPEWNEVCRILAVLYKLYSRPTGNLTTEVLEAPEVLKALDELMQAYDEWLG